MTDKDFARYRQGTYIKNEINLVDTILKQLSAGGCIYIGGVNLENADLNGDIKKHIRKIIVRDLKCYRESMQRRFDEL